VSKRSKSFINIKYVDTTKKMKIFVLHILLLTAICVSIFSQPNEFIAGESYFGSANYIEYIAGNLPIIISVPHDGNLNSDFLADRKLGSSARDYGTLDIAGVIQSEIKKITGKYPHIIISHLSRKKLDPNREESEAAQDDQLAINAWNEYHGFIDTALAISELQYGWGFFIDLHGHKHPEQRIEIGYCLDNEILALPDEDLNSEELIYLSSLRNMLKFAVKTHAELIRGDESLGAIFDKYDVSSTPSPSDPFPDSDVYFYGGYTTFRHVVMNDGNISGVQFEINSDLREPGECKSTGKILAKVILEFLTTHWGKGFLISNQ
jgi:hypothetical protein